MKRDPDLIKKILLEYEKYPANFGKQIVISGYSEEEVVYHQILLLDDDYIVGQRVIPLGSTLGYIIPERLTNKGHDFLELAKNDTAWTKTKKKILDQGGGFAMELMSKILTEVAYRMMMG